MKMHYTIAERTVKHYVCATCWGQLTRVRDDHETDDVFCGQCGETTFVTRTYVDGAKGASSAELNEVLQVMYDAGELPRPPKKSVKQTLAELGY